MQRTDLSSADVPQISPEALSRLRSWEGRSEVLRDEITRSPIDALTATLDRDDAPAMRGSVLPLLWHWLYFLPHAPDSDLGEDGHPRLGGFLPPVPLPRRMWAGGRLQWHAPLQIGEGVRRTSRIASVTHKAGRSGDLVFVLVQHEVSVGQQVVLTEEQDLVYRAPPRPGDPPPPPQAAPDDAVWKREIRPDPVLLFRYSALTFNGHRIHYDRSYATEVEAYPGLVVHGPLIATLLMDLIRRERPDAAVCSFSFRAVRPLYDLHVFHVCGKPSPDGKSAHLWAEDNDGGLAMQAVAHFR